MSDPISETPLSSGHANQSPPPALSVALPAHPLNLPVESVLAAASVGFRTKAFAQLTTEATARAMTRETWQACCDPLAMLCLLRGRGSGRKFRLFAVACARDEFTHGAIPEEECHLLQLPEYYAKIEAAESFADGGPELRYEGITHWVAQPVCNVITDEDVAHAALGFNADIGLWMKPIEEIVPAIIGRYRTHPSHYLRDIFGNPFAPVAFSAEWRTSTAVGLAKQLYESRDFSTMPILADALQDAGCNSVDILNHCRDVNQAHLRGCWVVDCLLEKI
jgi:hypothetical protein